MTLAGRSFSRERSVKCRQETTDSRQETRVSRMDARSSQNGVGAGGQGFPAALRALLVYRISVSVGLWCFAAFVFLGWLIHHDPMDIDHGECPTVFTMLAVFLLGALLSPLIVLGLALRRRWALFLALAQDLFMVVVVSWSTAGMYRELRGFWLRDMADWMIESIPILVFLVDAIWISAKTRPYWRFTPAQT